jgi:hypothetical protein
VESLAAACDRARARGYEIVGHDERPGWAEAFLHPKQALGIVIQLAEEHPFPEGTEAWNAGWDVPRCPPPAEPPARIVGLRLTARSAAAARRQWGELLGGRERVDGERLVFEWPDSPLRMSVRVDASRADGPEAIEVRCPRRLALAAGRHSQLGARFEQIA